MKPNLENLQKVADYLKAGKLKARFDMQYFCATPLWEGLTDFETARNVIGHSAFLFEKEINETWVDFSHRLFNLDIDSWNFLFREDWSYIDDYDEATHPESVQIEQAIKRIEMFIANGGQAPEEWDYTDVY